MVGRSSRERRDADVVAALERGHGTVAFELDASDFVITYVGANVYAALGYAADDVVGLSGWWPSHLYPEEADEILASLARELAAQTPWLEHQFRLRHRDGSHPWFAASAVIDYEGRAPVLRGVATDVTERVLAEARLRNSDERFRTLVEAAPVMVSSVALDGTVTSLNEAFETITGWPRSAWMGRRLLSLLHPDDLAAGLDRLHNGATGTANRPYELRLRTAGGEYRVVEFTSAPLVRDGVVEEIVGVGRDVTDRRRAERALRESEERFRRVFEDGPVAIALVDLDFRFTDVNEAFCQMTGFAREELLASTFLAITHPDDAGADAELARRLFDGEIPSYRIEKRYVRRDGTLAFANLTRSVVRDERGAALYGVAIMEDVTERKRLEHELASAARRGAEVLARLTDREARVLELLAEGLSAPRIARELSVSPRTVESHQANAYRKLGVRSGHDAVAEFTRSRAAVAQILPAPDPGRGS